LLACHHDRGETKMRGKIELKMGITKKKIETQRENYGYSLRDFKHVLKPLCSLRF